MGDVTDTGNLIVSTANKTFGKWYSILRSKNHDKLNLNSAAVYSYCRFRMLQDAANSTRGSVKNVNYVLSDGQGSSGLRRKL